MNETEFWSLIDAARYNGGRCRNQAYTLEDLLANLPATEIIGFREILDRLQHACYTWDLWAAAYTINGGCSDDCFMDFRSWLVMQGRNVFYNAVEDPDTLADIEINIEHPDTECLVLSSVVWRAYETKTGTEMPERERMPIGGDPAGEPWDEDTFDTRYPRLAAKFGYSEE